MNVCVRTTLTWSCCCRQELQTQLDAQQTANEVRQHFQLWTAEWPWTMHVPGANMAHAQQPLLLDMLPVYIASDPQRCQSHGLLSAFLARRADWDTLKCIRYPHTVLGVGV